jgi:hypothetical protein
MAILGHELVHHLKTTNPKLYEEFVLAVRPFIQDGGYAKFAKNY